MLSGRSRLSACKVGSYRKIKRKRGELRPLLNLTGFVWNFHDVFFQWDFVSSRRTPWKLVQERLPIPVAADPPCSAHLAGPHRAGLHQLAGMTLWRAIRCCMVRDARPELCAIGRQRLFERHGPSGHRRAQIESPAEAAEFVVQSGVFLLQQHPSRALEQAIAQIGLARRTASSASPDTLPIVGLLQSIADSNTPVIYLDCAGPHLAMGRSACRASPSTCVSPQRSSAPRSINGAYRVLDIVVVDSVYSTTGAVVSADRKWWRWSEKHGCDDSG